MPATAILAANHKNASIAGHTGVKETLPTTAVHATASELVYGADSLGHMLAGGVHPETNLASIFTNNDVERATDSVKGALGGLVPKVGSVLQAGPAGGANAARNIMHRLGL